MKVPLIKTIYRKYFEKIVVFSVKEKINQKTSRIYGHLQLLHLKQQQMNMQLIYRHHQSMTSLCVNIIQIIVNYINVVHYDVRHVEEGEINTDINTHNRQQYNIMQRKKNVFIILLLSGNFKQSSQVGRASVAKKKAITYKVRHKLINFKKKIIK